MLRDGCIFFSKLFCGVLCVFLIVAIFSTIEAPVLATGSWEFLWESKNLDYKLSGALGRHGAEYERSRRRRKNIQDFALSMELILKHLAPDTNIELSVYPGSEQLIDELAEKVNVKRKQVSEYIEKFYLPSEIHFSPSNQGVAILEYNPLKEYRIRLVSLEGGEEVILSAGASWIGAIKWNHSGHGLFYKTPYHFHRIPIGAPKRQHKKIKASVLNHRDDSVIWLNNGTILSVGLPVNRKGSEREVDDNHSRLALRTFGYSPVDFQLDFRSDYIFRRLGKSLVGLGYNRRDGFELCKLIRHHQNRLLVHDWPKSDELTNTNTIQNIDSSNAPLSFDNYAAQFEENELKVGPFAAKKGFLPAGKGFYLVDANWDLYYFSDIAKQSKILTLMKTTLFEKPYIKIENVQSSFSTEGGAYLRDNDEKLPTAYYKPGVGLKYNKKKYTRKSWALYRKIFVNPPNEQPLPDLPEYLSFKVFKKRPGVKKKNLVALFISPRGNKYLGIYWKDKELKYYIGSTGTDYLSKTIYPRKYFKELAQADSYIIPRKIERADEPIQIRKFKFGMD